MAPSILKPLALPLVRLMLQNSVNNVKINSKIYCHIAQTSSASWAKPPDPRTRSLLLDSTGGKAPRPPFRLVLPRSPCAVTNFPYNKPWHTGYFVKGLPGGNPQVRLWITNKKQSTHYSYTIT